MSEILHRVDGAVLWITMNRPAAKNALTHAQRDTMIDLLESSRAPEIRCVVITGTGDSFCSGADLSAAPKAGTRAPGEIAQMLKDGAQRFIAAVMDCRLPVIAAVNGVAAGIGAHLAFACDLVVAAEDARFIEVFARRGLVPDGGGAYLLPRLIGLHKTKELMFFAEAVSASDARELGLVNRVVPADELEAAAAEWAERLASGPTLALAAAKRLVNASLESDRETSFKDEANAVEANMATDDSQEGIRAFFVDRRKPEFKGR